MAQTKQNQKMTYGIPDKYDYYRETPFMELGNQIYREYKYCVAIYDKYPVCTGHLLFIPKANNADHIQEAFRYALEEGEFQTQNNNINGYHLGMNMHRAGGQSVDWPHVHFIPRHYGDTGDNGDVGSVRLARRGGKNPTSYKTHPRYKATT